LRKFKKRLLKTSDKLEEAENSVMWSNTICVLHQIQDDQKVSVHLKITVHASYDLKMAITERIRNADRAILNTVFENTFRRVNKCLETGGGHFEHYL
jgi:translation initiation factor 2 gamma subunit (eIF-2gamma)